MFGQIRRYRQVVLLLLCSQRLWGKLCLHTSLLHIVN